MITSSYNRGRWLEVAIMSVVNQTYSNWEMHVVDDGSHKPEALAVLEKFSKYDPRIHIHMLYTNYGDSQFPKNYGISKSSGEFIAIFDDDDIMVPERLMVQVQHMLDHPEVDVIGSRMNTMQDDNDTVVGKYFATPMKKEEMRLRMLFMNYMSHSTAMIRYNDKNKEFVHYDLISAEDYDLWLRLMYVHNFTFEIIDHFLVNYRLHS